MKRMFLIGILIINCLVYSQNKKINEIKDEVSKIEKLKQKDKLDLVPINYSKTCGGNTIGYFYANDLTLIISEDGGENTTIKYKYYIKENNIIKIEVLEKYVDGNDKKQKTYSEKKELYFTPEIAIIKNFDKEKIITYSDEQVIKCGKTLIELLRLEVNLQELVGRWKVFSYEDEIAYFNKTTDSISYKDSSRKEEAESFRQMSELMIFPISYNFNKNGSFAMNHQTMGEISSGQFEIDKSNKKIVLIDGKGKKNELPYIYTNEILFVEMKMETGYIKLGLKKS